MALSWALTKWNEAGGVEADCWRAGLKVRVESWRVSCVDMMGGTTTRYFVKRGEKEGEKRE